MRTLAIETASEACSVALFEDSVLVAHDHRVLGRGHAELLIPMIADLPGKGMARRILVSLGPGSFTGLRVGLAAARALGVAWNVPVLGYPTMRLVQLSASLTETRAVTVCMNGGHGEWFVQDFDADGVTLHEVQSLTPEAVRETGTKQVIAGNRAKECADLFSDHRLALELLPDARQSHLLQNAHLLENLTPIYGRAPDATPQKQRVSS